MLELSTQGLRVCKKANEEIKDKYLSCSHLRKLYREMWLNSPSILSTNNIAAKQSTANCLEALETTPKKGGHSSSVFLETTTKDASNEKV